MGHPGMTTIITTRTICSECDEARALRFVAHLRAAGWDVEYGGTGPTPDGQPLLREIANADALDAHFIARRWLEKQTTTGKDTGR